MDVIIKGVFASKHSHEMKLTVLKRIVENCPSQGSNVNKRVFQFCCLVKMDGSGLPESQLADYVLDGWTTTNIGDAWLFLLNELLPDKEGNFVKLNNSEEASAGRVDAIAEFLKVLHAKDPSRVSQTAPAITWKLSLMYTKCDDLHSFAKMVAIFRDYSIYLEQCAHKTDLIAATVAFLARLEFSDDEKQDLLQTLASVTSLSDFIGKIVSDQKELLLLVMNEVFSHVYTDNLTPSSCLASLLTHFPVLLIDSIAKRVTKDGALTNDRMAIIVGRVIEWISWPGVKNISEWIVGFLKALYLEKRFSVICSVIEEKAVKIFSYVVYPMFRDHAITVSSFLLLSYQHDPQVFHKVVPAAVFAIEKLEQENSPASISLRHSVVELMFTLMYQFPGFPDIYSQLMDVLKNEERPSESKMKEWLMKSRFTGLDSESVVTSISPTRVHKSETGKVGLVNLGNTCYMNSVVQALYMLKRFRHRILSTNFSPLQHRASFHLQKLFALLLMSERPSISPTLFYSESRPTWFFRGAQQDCSEFLKYLLDCLDRECTTPACSNESMHSLFCGEAAICTRCLSCQGISCKREAFNDISLSFPDQSHGDCAEGGALLKGGDLSCNSPYGKTEDSNTGKVTCNEAVSNLTTLEPLHPDDTAGASQAEAKSADSTDNLAFQPPLLSAADLLRVALGTEVLTYANRYYCDGCASLQNAERKMTIIKAPHYLVLTLNRFTYDVSTHTRGKVLKNLKYPSLLELDVYSGDIVDNRTDMEQIFQAGTASGTNDAGTMGTVEMHKEIFELCSIVVHSGISSDCGHYYSYCAEKESAASLVDTDMGTDSAIISSSTESTENWYMFNDSRVTFTNREAIARVSGSFPRDTPYLLIYKNISSEAGCEVEEPQCTVLEELVAMVDADNQRYQQDLREQEANQKRKHNGFNDRFDDDGSAGGCGGPSSGGLGLNGPRFIY